MLEQNEMKINKGNRNHIDVRKKKKERLALEFNITFSRGCAEN